MVNKWVTRQSLLLRAKDPNDHQAWDEFVKYYKTFIHTILYQMNFRVSDYKDIEQDILVKIWKKLPAFEIDGDRALFRTWLSTLIRNSVLDHIKCSRRYERRRDTAASNEILKKELVSQHEFEAIVEKEWVRHLTKTALSNVKELFSGVAVEAFELALAGKSLDEIGEQLGITSESACTLKNRVKLRLIKEIDRLRKELEF